MNLNILLRQKLWENRDVEIELRERTTNLINGTDPKLLSLVRDRYAQLCRDEEAAYAENEQREWIITGQEFLDALDPQPANKERTMTTKPITLKPFDLEAAKAGAPIITRSGEPVKFVGHVPEADLEYRVVVMHMSTFDVVTHCEDGRLYAMNEELDEDLFMAPVKRTAYVVLWDDGVFKTCADAFESEEQAQARAAYYRHDGYKVYGIFPIEIED